MSKTNVQSDRRRAKQPPNELCPALVSLVFLHTFFSLAQFCKKPCNPVFNVLEFFKNAKKYSCSCWSPHSIAIEAKLSRRALQTLKSILQSSLQEEEVQPLAYHEAVEEWSYFSNLLQAESQKGQKFKKAAAEQHSSPQGCTVRPETSAGLSSLGWYLAPVCFPFPNIHVWCKQQPNPSASGAFDFHVICSPGRVALVNRGLEAVAACLLIFFINPRPRQPLTSTSVVSMPFGGSDHTPHMAQI
jgi:hypothetical protein